MKTNIKGKYALSTPGICKMPQFVPEIQHSLLVMNDNHFLREGAVDENETRQMGETESELGRRVI